MEGNGKARYVDEPRNVPIRARPKQDQAERLEKRKKEVNDRKGGLLICCTSDNVLPSSHEGASSWQPLNATPGTRGVHMGKSLQPLSNERLCMPLDETIQKRHCQGIPPPAVPIDEPRIT